jgi:hypothetical protein
VNWKDKHTVMLLSSIHFPAEIEEERREEAAGVTQIS